MEFYEALKTELSSIAGLSGKVFPHMAEQGTVSPYLTYAQNNNERIQTLSGHDGLVEPQHELALYHESYVSLKALKKLVIAKIKTFNQRNLAVTGPFVEQVRIINDFETFDYLDGKKIYKGIIELDAHYNEEA